MKFCPHCEREFDDSIEVCPGDGNRLVRLHVDDNDLVGRTIDERFHIIEKIGEGGMGTVYLAIQRPIGRKVALKVLSRSLVADDGAVKRFFHEAKVVSKLRHPNTITLYDFGQSSNDLLYIAMEYMTGESLDKFVCKENLSLKDVIEITKQICESLSEAHQIGIVHRDLKPENIFIDRVGSRNIIKVLDFGIAKIQGIQSNLTLTGMVFGTPAYMSPEQSQGFKLDHRADIYSLGVLFYELVCGQLPYLGETAMKVAMAHILEPVPDPTEMTLFQPLPARLAELIMEMLAKPKEDRPESADAVLTRLRDIERELDDFPLSSRPVVAVDENEVQTAILESSREQSAQMVLLRERDSSEVSATEQRVRRPTATGPQRPKELFDTADYMEYATARYPEGEITEERPIPPELIEVESKKWGYWATVGMVLMAAAMLFILFGPRTRDRLNRLDGTQDRGSSAASSELHRPDDTEGRWDQEVVLVEEQSPLEPAAIGSESTLPGQMDTGHLSPASEATIAPEVAPLSEGSPPMAPPGVEPALQPAEGTAASSGGEPERPLITATEAQPEPTAGRELSAPSPTSPALDREPEPPAQPVESDVAALAPPETVTIAFQTTPSRVRIIRVDDGQELCRTTDSNPCEAELPYGREDIVVEGSRRRYQSRQFSFRPDRSETYHISLERVGHDTERRESGRFRLVDQHEEPPPEAVSESQEQPREENEGETVTEEEPSPDEGVQLMGPVTFESPVPSDEEVMQPVD